MKIMKNMKNMKTFENYIKEDYKENINPDKYIGTEGNVDYKPTSIDIKKAIKFVKNSKLFIDENAIKVAKILQNPKAEDIFIELSPGSKSVEQLINDVVDNLFENYNKNESNKNESNKYDKYYVGTKQKNPDTGKYVTNIYIGNIKYRWNDEYKTYNSIDRNNLLTKKNLKHIDWEKSK